MKKLIIIFSSILFFNFSNAQTGIGTTTPNASAKLDVYSTNKGFLPPRVTLTSVTDVTTIASPAEGLLIYNLGSVGLQAGYYYWNGANWATIATATSAGNGVTASNLVNLYAKAYSTATGDIANSSGYSFTVPVSGRYLFDFTSTGYANSADFTMSFKVRNCTTSPACDIGTDAQTSASNTVHVEYNGKVEVNLQAGTTYNVIVTSTGLRNSSDYDRVYYKLIAGNLPVIGQSVDYISVSRTTDLTVNTGDIVKFNSINSGNIPYDPTTGKFSLIAGKTYKLSASISLSNANSSVSETSVVWKNAAGDALPNRAEILSSSHSTNAGGNAFAEVIYTPSVNTTVNLYVAYATASAILWNSYTYANIEQIGTSAFVNPWTLSGNNTYNTNGNVGIGTSTPSTTLDVTGNVNVTGKINLTDPTGNVTTKAAGFVDAGTYVTLDNVRATVNTSGSRGLGLATVTGSFSAFINGTYTVYTTGTNGQGTSLTITTTTASSSLFGWNFVSQGDASTYIVNDITNKRIYRITLMIGGGYYSNLITIERLL